MQRQLEAYGIREPIGLGTCRLSRRPPNRCKGSSKPTEFERVAKLPRAGGGASCKGSSKPTEFERRLLRPAWVARTVVQRQLEAYGIRERVLVDPALRGRLRCKGSSKPTEFESVEHRLRLVQRQLEAYGIREGC